MENPEDGDQINPRQRAHDEGRPPGSLRRQLVGSLVGAGIALIVYLIGRQLGWLGGDTIQFLLWGGVIGGLIGGSDALAQAGKRLTGRDEDWINILVSLVGMAVISGALLAIAWALTELVRMVSGR